MSNAEEGDVTLYTFFRRALSPPGAEVGTTGDVDGEVEVRNGVVLG